MKITKTTKTIHSELLSRDQAQGYRLDAGVE
jgi:hypothetical protein